jgi:hypothetical protein
MGLAWQQGPFGQSPSGQFLLEQPLPAHVLYAEPAGRRMRVELAGAVVAQSERVADGRRAPPGRTPRRFRSRHDWPAMSPSIPSNSK